MIVPGFVDMHVHGGGGGSYTTGEPKDAVEAAAFHLSHGTTTIMASFITDPVEQLARGVEALSELVADGVLAGLHLEGPYLAPAQRARTRPSGCANPTGGRSSDCSRWTAGRCGW